MAIDYSTSAIKGLIALHVDSWYNFDIIPVGIHVVSGSVQSGSIH